MLRFFVTQAGRARSIGLLAAFAALAVLVACTSSDPAPSATNTVAPRATDAPAMSTPAPTATSAPANTPSPTRAAPTATPTPVSPAPGVAAKVDVRSDADYGDILVDGDGLTLYIFDRDTEGVSNCAGGCLAAWPPLLTEEAPETGENVGADIGTITREDGTLQVTVNGFPAYYWQNDAEPGDTLGHGVGTVWWVFNPDGTPQRPAKVGLTEDPTLGNILVDGDGFVLYIFDRDTEGVSNCSGGCLAAWPPLITDYPPAAQNGVEATLGTITRDDGTMQVTVNGYPAYYWQNDAEPGDTLGHGVGTVWWVFNADGTPQRPAKVGLTEDPTLGNILVDGNGFTLYLFDNDTEGVSNCSGGCLAAWPPLLTEYPPAAKKGVEATLGTTTREDGTMQVTVNGFPVYYWQNDAEAGDTLGQGVNDIWWVMDALGDAIRN